jgi:hypothetical protein
MMCRRAAPHMLQQEAAGSPSHAHVGSPSWPARQGPACGSAGRPTPHLQPSSRPQAPVCPGSRRTDVLPSSAAAAWPRPSYVVCSSGSRSSPSAVLMSSALSLSRTRSLRRKRMAHSVEGPTRPREERGLKG